MKISHSQLVSIYNRLKYLKRRDCLKTSSVKNVDYNSSSNEVLFVRFDVKQNSDPISRLTRFYIQDQNVQVYQIYDRAYTPDRYPHPSIFESRISHDLPISRS